MIDIDFTREVSGNKGKIKVVYSTFVSSYNGKTETKYFLTLDDAIKFFEKEMKWSGAVPYFEHFSIYTKYGKKWEILSHYNHSFIVKKFNELKAV